jgi:hypothetical protein
MWGGALSRALGLVFRGATLGATAFLVVAPAAAQDVNGAPNADVRSGARSASLRLAYGPSDPGHPETFAAQIGYAQNLSDRWGVSGALFFAARGADPFAFRAGQAIVQYQFAENETAGADFAALVIARIPDAGDGPGRVTSGIAGRWTIAEDWDLRAAGAMTVEIGARARSGLGLGTRIEATRRIGAVGRLGFHLADGFGTTAKFGPFRAQSHQAGLVAKTLIGDSLQVTGLALFGVTAAAPEAEFKLFLTRDL